MNTHAHQRIAKLCCYLHYVDILLINTWIDGWMKPLNPLMGTLKPQSNGPLYSNTLPGTLAVDGWAVTFGTARMDLGQCTNFMLFDVVL